MSAGCFASRLNGCSTRFDVLARDRRYRNAQNAGDPVNCGGPGPSLLALDVGQRRLGYPHFPREVRLMPTVFLAQAANGSAVLAQPPAG